MPQVTSLGGVNISQLSRDAGMAFTNPALLIPAMHLQTPLVFNHYPGNIRNYSAMTVYQAPRLGTTFGLGLHYVDYGTLPQTDAAGNILGRFRPSDYFIQAMASRSYLNRWRYGAALRFLQSAYGPYRASALDMDIGICYTDSLNGFRLAFTASHMGVVIRKYAGTESAELPFDLRLGISKKLKDAPIQVSLNAHQLQGLDWYKADSTSISLSAAPRTFAGKLLAHLVAGAQVYVGDKIEISAGYHFLRRRELNIGNSGNGWNGFSLGVGLLLKRLQFRYARSYLGSVQAVNQIGLSLSFQNR